MEKKTTTSSNSPVIDSMFKAGAHFAFSKSRRHPTAAPFIFGAKNKVEIFDLEKTHAALDTALAFVKSLGKEGKQLLIVGGKSEARKAVKDAATALDMPFVDGRWIGGTLTNSSEIRRRVEKLERLTLEREKGELAKYTKKERLLIDREIDNLEIMFSGVVSLKGLPGALIVVDPKQEHIAVKEAQDKNVKVVAIAGSDCDLSEVDYAIVGNDASQSSIHFFMNEIVKAYQEGKKEAPVAPKTAPVQA